MSAPQYIRKWLAESGGIAAVVRASPRRASTAAYFEGAWAKPEIIGPFACCGYDIAPGVLFSEAYDGYLLGSKTLGQEVHYLEGSSARVRRTLPSTTAGAANPGRHRYPAPRSQTCEQQADAPTRRLRFSTRDPCAQSARRAGCPGVGASRLSIMPYPETLDFQGESGPERRVRALTWANFA